MASGFYRKNAAEISTKNDEFNLKLHDALDKKIISMGRRRQHGLFLARRSQHLHRVPVVLDQLLQVHLVSRFKFTINIGEY